MSEKRKFEFGFKNGIVGLLGVLLVQGSTFPQVIKSWTTKNVTGVSFTFWWSLLLGLCCYMYYAIRRKDWIYILSNSIGIIGATMMLILLYRYGGTA